MSLLDDLLSGGLTAFERLVTAQAGEGVELEFKGSQSFRDGVLDRDGRRTLGRELSSFSNSAGGLIVFGVDCRRDQDGVDRAVGITPVPHLGLAETSIHSVLSDLLSPHHDGIRVHRVNVDKDVGFIIVEVPKSPRRPHMAALEKSYYRRVGTSSLAMDHYDVEDAFRWSTAPDLELDWELSASDWPASQGTTIDYRLQLAARNQGGATARHICLRFAPGASPGLSDHSRFTQPRVTGVEFANVRTYAFPSDLVVHPQEIRPLLPLFFTLTFLDSKAQGRLLKADGSVSLTLELLSEDMRPKDFVINIPPNQLRDLAARWLPRMA